jgi:hypothetical protein
MRQAGELAKAGDGGVEVSVPKKGIGCRSKADGCGTPAPHVSSVAVTAKHWNMLMVPSILTLRQKTLGRSLDIFLPAESL